MTDNPPRRPVYLDYHATTPVDPRVLEAMLPFYTEVFGNAASADHLYGAEAATAVERARAEVATLINARPDEIVFTSGATESINLAIRGIAERRRAEGDHIITAATEHKAVIDTCGHLERNGWRISRLPVDKYGQIDPAAVRAAVTNKTVLISIMAANNEIGTVAPIAAIGEIAKEHRVTFHTDATQAMAYLDVDVQRDNVDLLSLSAHKIYGPKGVGVLYVRKRNPRIALDPLLYGGGHERGLRSGTLNVPGIVGLGKAAALLDKRVRTVENQRVAKMRDKLSARLLTEVPDVSINGAGAMARLPNNLSVTILGVESRSLLVALRDRVAIAVGSACTTAKVEPSHVLLAIGRSEVEAFQTVRISLGRFTTADEVSFASVEIRDAIARLRRLTATS